MLVFKVSQVSREYGFSSHPVVNETGTLLFESPMKHNPHYEYMKELE
jgi:hypothetical protein